MHYYLFVIHVPLLLSTGVIGAPLAGASAAQEPHSLESIPGPYEFEEAPVWPHEADKEPPVDSLESTPGPHKFNAAPVWRRDGEQPACGSVESCPGPYQFEPAPVEPDTSNNTNSNPNHQKGAGLWAAWHIGDMVKDSGATWAYSWGADPAWAFSNMGQAVPSGVELVPMVFDPSKADETTLRQIKSTNAKVVLGYNEPDGKVPLADAVSAWTNITKKLSGLRIGSPAPAYTNVDNPDDWFVQFMQKTKANGAKVDFICLHHYAKENDVASAVEHFKKYLDGVYAKYNLPIWVTEYAMVDYYDLDVTKYRVPDVAIQERYVTESAAMLKSLSYVERFAWFAIPQNDAQPPTNLYTQDQYGWQRTRFGEAYRAV
ncbi:MAG: hypothetical protein L6R38_005367 [Xanthoria sp. 2 TBL-2021]|nr:MAG: hypothetical protein L6R38_005367 [Xanthoria sp. 2 TBL-2021]